MIESLVSIGKITKPHGIEGGFKIAIKEPFDWVDLTNKFIFINLEGLPVPFFVLKYDSGNIDQIYLEKIESKEAAKKFAGQELFVESEVVEIDNEYGSNPYTWKGYSMVDLTSEQTGMIRNIEEYPQQLMATIELENGEILIPIHEDFLISVDDLSKTITVKLPEGLFG